MRAAAVGLVLVLVLALPAFGAQPRRASLELRSTDPVVVVGRGFVPREPILVTATAGTIQRIVPLIARRNGTFKARFRLRLGRCAAVTVLAVGTRGSRAILQVDPGCRRPRGPADGPPLGLGQPPA